jgi:ubiquinone/menaquinone biosynthesis C-methylase UbiE
VADLPGGNHRPLAGIVGDGLGQLVRDLVAARVAVVGTSELSVLDAGGGTGHLAVPLAQAGHRVTVVDPTLDSLAALERRAAEVGVSERVTAVQGDAVDLPDLLEPGSIDLALCHNVLEMVDDPVQSLAGIAVVLRTGGLLSLLAANRHAVVLSRVLSGHLADARRALADPNGRWGDADPIPRRFTMDHLQQLVAQCGLVAEAVHGVRVFADLVPGALLSDARDTADLAALEAASANHPAFRELAVHLHVRGRKV